MTLSKPRSSPFPKVTEPLPSLNNSHGILILCFLPGSKQGSSLRAPKPPSQYFILGFKDRNLEDEYLEDQVLSSKRYTHSYTNTHKDHTRTHTL